jgi:hypothetical protein
MKKVSTKKGAAQQAATTATATTKKTQRSASFEKAKTMSQAEAREAKKQAEAQALLGLVKGFNFDASLKSIIGDLDGIWEHKTLPLARKMANLEKQIKAVTNAKSIKATEWELFGVRPEQCKSKLVGKWCRVGRSLANKAQERAFEKWCNEHDKNKGLRTALECIVSKGEPPPKKTTLVSISVNAEELGTEKGGTMKKTATGWDGTMSKAEMRTQLLKWAEELA